jgi:hypothetical protein
MISGTMYYRQLETSSSVTPSWTISITEWCGKAVKNFATYFKVKVLNISTESSYLALPIFQPLQVILRYFFETDLDHFIPKSILTIQAMLA